MKDLKSIIQAAERTDFSKQKAAIATVVRVRGSSYRSPGARMLITDDGRWTGSISGGCLEGDALRKARKVMADKVPLTVTYDTREESNQNLGIGLGCNGVIDVLIEPIESENNPLSLFRKIIDSEKTFALATIFNGESGSGEKMMLASDGQCLRKFSDEKLNTWANPLLRDQFVNQKSGVHTYSVDTKEVEVFFELLQPSISLIIFGGGFDARPVSELAKSLGWKVTVTDECVAHIAPAFFPSADRLSLCDRTFIDRDFNITPYTACVLMSHNYEYDRDVLRTLLNHNAPYIGILGPRKRFDKMLDGFHKEKIEVPSALMHCIHSPIGLDIGAEAPDEIAVSIIAEIQGKFSERSGGFLKYRNGPIHQRINEDHVNKQVYLPNTLQGVSGTS